MGEKDLKSLKDVKDVDSFAKYLNDNEDQVQDILSAFTMNDLINQLERRGVTNLNISK